LTFIVTNTLKCPECGNINFHRDFERGEITCTSCGIVLASSIDLNDTNWKILSREQVRVGPSISNTLHDYGLATDINVNSINNSSLTLREKLKIARLARWHRKVSMSNSLDRNLTQGFSEIQRLVNQLSLSKSVHELACRIYRSVASKRHFKGRSIAEVASASVFIACKKLGMPRMFNEIVKHSKVDKRKVIRGYHLIINTLNEKPIVNSPEIYIPRIMKALNCSPQIEDKARGIIESVRPLFNGKNPVSLIAAAIYISCLITGQRKSQHQIAQAAGITEVTLRKRMREILNKIHVEVKI